MLSPTLKIASRLPSPYLRKWRRVATSKVGEKFLSYLSFERKVVANKRNYYFNQPTKTKKRMQRDASTGSANVLISLKISE